MSNRWSSHPHWGSHVDRSRGGWSMQAAAVTLGGTIGLLATTTAVAVRGGMILIGGDCGYGWEGRALPPVAAPESTAVAVPRPVALVPQPAAVAVPGTANCCRRGPSSACVSVC